MLLFYECIAISSREKKFEKKSFTPITRYKEDIPHGFKWEESRKRDRAGIRSLKKE